jgi:membrane-bound inhibitor of C-type lysozyme
LVREGDNVSLENLSSIFTTETEHQDKQANTLSEPANLVPASETILTQVQIEKTPESVEPAGHKWTSRLARISPILGAIGVVVIGLVALAGYEIWYGQHAKVGTPSSTPVEESSSVAAANKLIQFRGLRAGLSKSEVLSLLSHPSDKLECKLEKNGEQTCKGTIRDSAGDLLFSPNGRLFGFHFLLFNQSGDSTTSTIISELTAPMGEGEPVEVGVAEKQLGARSFEWKTGKKVHCVVKSEPGCSSEELTLMLSSSVTMVDFTDWGYVAEREGYKGPDPNALHPTVDARFALFGLSGGLDSTTSSNALEGEFGRPTCQDNQHDMTYQCRFSRGTSRLELNFFRDRLASLYYSFPTSQWADRLQSFKESLHGEPTKSESSNSEELLTWISTAHAPCLLAREEECPDETLMMDRSKGKQIGKAIYTYTPVMIEQIRAMGARDENPATGVAPGADNRVSGEEHREASRKQSRSVAGGETRGPFSYSCENGTTFAITFHNTSDTYSASIKINGGAEVLTSVRAASGAHYSGGRYSFDEWHGEVHLTDNTKAPSQRTTSCSLLPR